MIIFFCFFFRNFEETFAFACLCSVLTVFPLYIVHEAKWEEFLNYLPESMYVFILFVLYP